MDAITTSKLTKEFPGAQGGSVMALDGLDLAIHQGEVFGFLGPNGAGKSTTIKLLLGLIHPSQGQAFLMGTPVDQPESRRQVGYLPESPVFYDYLNAVEYLAFVGGMFRMAKSAIDSRSESLLHRLNLWVARNRPIRSYSKGMVQRLGIAQTLLHDPKIYILDEPMSGLDPLGRALVKEIIQELREAGKCVFFSTHITNDVEAVCDRVGVIIKGQLQTVEKVKTIMASGITGYRVHHSSLGETEPRETTINKEKLPEFIAELRQGGEEIMLVEPLRKNLEDFFLNIVNQGKHNDG